jgi:antagonist of KipI
MDACSHRLANALVGNAREAATLEIALIGPEIEFEDERDVAVVGADFHLSIDDAPALMSRCVHVARGACLRFGSRQRGARAYLAVSGGIATETILGSRATHLVSRMGGLQGRAIAAGDRLPLGDFSGSRHSRATDGRSSAGVDRIVDTVSAIQSGGGRVRILPGPQRDWFDASALRALETAEYRVGNQSDRMGYRLEGPTIMRQRAAEMLSDATPIGALQVPGHGGPILLMADRQTTGGYPKLAVVISADIGIAGQLGPGDSIAFEICTREEAVAACAAQEEALRAIERPIA